MGWEGGLGKVGAGRGGVVKLSFNFSNHKTVIMNYLVINSSYFTYSG